MPPYDIFFWSIISFLEGVFLASLGLNLLIAVLIAVLTAAVLTFIGLISPISLIRPIRLIGLITLMIVCGSLYYSWDDIRFGSQNIIFDQKFRFAAQVIDRPEISLKSQKLKLRLLPPYKGNILTNMRRYPKYNYGDILNLEGSVKKPESGYADYLNKERISGIVSFPPQVELTAENKGNPFRSFLFRLKDKILSSFKKIMPPEPAALLAGITLGERAEFSKEFETAMVKSGTTHLTALSGYNISVVGIAIAGLLNKLFSKRISSFFSSLAIIAFVFMTGAEASAVRAGVMGLILILAREQGRIFDFRNVISFTALFMILLNPKILRFDLGFQLSFLALIGIIYLAPILKKFLRFEILNTAISAQLAVTPLIIYNFGYFPLQSVLSNLLILPTVPAVMFLGFLIPAVSLFSYHFSFFIGWAAYLILNYQIFIIRILGS